jgi:hypothetical protein
MKQIFFAARSTVSEKDYTALIYKIIIIPGKAGIFLSLKVPKII